MALAAGASPHNVPFKGVELLPADNGERFFSEYITWLKGAKVKYDLASRCLCQVCHTSTGPSQQQQQQMQPQKPTNEETQTQTLVQPVQPERIPEHINNKPTADKNNFIANSVHQVPNGEHPKQQVEMRPAKQPAQQQQQSQPWQYQMIQPQLQSAPHPPWMGVGYASPMPLFTPYPPWIAAPHPVTAPTTAVFCCGRYRAWHNTAGRRGRPPHDDHCQWRRRLLGKTGKQIDSNPSSRAI